MGTERTDLILHPLRMRIIQSLLIDRQLTAQQIGALLPDVPQATLYRHLQKLVQGGVVAVVDERPVRGAIERRYALARGGASLGPEDLAAAGPDDHMHYFATFVATLLGDYARYLRRERIDLAADGVGYRQVALHLSDAELAELAQALNTALRPFLEHGPAPGRRRRILSTILMPADD